MSEPPYHLRTNKHVERLLFVELLDKIRNSLSVSIDSYPYIGLGGPYLADFALMQNKFQFQKMTSLETKRSVRNRQKFNLPHCRVDTTEKSTARFVGEYEGKEPLIAWFDYSSPDWVEQVHEFCDLVHKAPSLSIVKATLACNSRSSGPLRSGGLAERAKRLTAMFGDYGPFSEEEVRSENFPLTMHAILRQAIGARLGDSVEHAAATLASFIYDDGTPILTVSLVIGKRAEIDTLMASSKLDNWEFAGLDWSEPIIIDVPILTLRERLAIDQHLPDASIKEILESVKLAIAGDLVSTKRALKQYVTFHRYVPFFANISTSY